MRVSSPSLISALRHFAKVTPNSNAVTYLPSEEHASTGLTYAELDMRARGLAEKLKMQFGGKPANDHRVVIALPPGLEFWVAFFATIYTGACAVATYAPKPHSRELDVGAIANVARLADAEFLITTRDQNFTGEAPFKNLNIIDVASWAETRHFPEPVVPNPEDVALMLFTSGSTGDPKGVKLTHGMISYNLGGMVKVFDLDQSSHSCAWLPNCHVAGFYMRMLPIMVGATCIEFPTQSFLLRPEYFLEVVDRYRVQMSAAPAFAYDMLSQSLAQLDPSVDLSCFALAITGGEPVKPSCYENFSQKFAPYGFKTSAFTPYYGMTETLCTTIRYPGAALPMASLSRRGLARHEACAPENDADRLDILSCGRPLGDNQVLVVDPQSREICSDAQIGEIVVAGKNVMPGYWKKDPATDRVVIDGYGEFFKTGDLGLERNGEIYVTGRIKELLIVRGKNHYPKDIEDSLMYLGARFNHFKCKAFSVDAGQVEALALAIECEPEITDEDITNIRQTISAQHGLSIEFLTALRPGELPLTNSGKIPRSVCKTYAMDGTWSQYLSQERQTDSTNVSGGSSTLEILKDTLANILSIKSSNICASSRIMDLGVDSIQSVKLLRRVQERTGQSVDLSWFYEDLNIADLAERINTSQGTSCNLLDETELFEQVDQVLKSAVSDCASKNGRLFVTGVTGFLGAYLLRELLQKSDLELHCLVRAENEAEGMRRVQTALKDISGFQNSWMERIHIVLGSLGSELFGLDEPRFNKLSQTVDAIVHNAANVNFVAPYQTLREVNVVSNLDILKLAWRHHKKTVHYISTVAVFNAPERDDLSTILETDWLEDPNSLYSGYAKSKWMSEKIYQRAREAGLDVKVYRPGLVLGDSDNGYCHTDDFVCRFLKGCLQMGRFPDIALELDMTPVNYAASGIIDLVLNDDINADAFHFLNPKPIRIKDLAAWYRKKGYPIRLEPSEDWHDKVENLHDENAMFPVTPFILDRTGPTGEGILEFFAKRQLNLSRKATQNELRHSISCMPIGDELLTRYMTYFIETGFLHPPP